MKNDFTINAYDHSSNFANPKSLKTMFQRFIPSLIILHLTSFGLALYSQASANSHYYDGRFIGIIYYVIAIFWLLLFIFNNRGLKVDYVAMIKMGTILVSLVGWGYYLRSLMCMNCLNSG